ncbi:restriction endonuclease subunit S [Kocuria marina]|uniref:restriction endonuclease subunit S n=1 Tax=Kocuria marina TaxID=223184 RepID=UPI0013F14B20|nr:restriction endonuclease subunit S [Kocuria indica]
MTLAEVCEAIVDCEHKTAPVDVEGGFFAVGTPAMRGNRISYSAARRISGETFEAWTRRLMPQFGDLLLAREAPVGPVVRMPKAANVAPGQRTVLLRPDPSLIDADYLYYLLISPTQQSRLLQKAEGSTVPHLNVADVRSYELPSLPPIAEQRVIAATLGALDDKIESNRRQRHLLRELGLAEYQASVRDDRKSLQLSAATVSIARGVAPKYADDDLDAALVINQKCIRDGWVSLAPARRMFDRSVKTEKRASSGDILVNSTGTGTLGRVARWHAGDIYVDGHVSVVKADHSVTSPTVLAYSLLGREADIEGLATGSTGQTELSAARLGELRVILPPTDQGSRLETTLITIEDRCDQLAAENTHLESTRDVLLPELLSGRIRVPVEGVEA